MAGKKMDMGPTGQTVAANVNRLREYQGLTYTQVSKRLMEAGRPIPPLAIRRIEEGERRVDADDLVALSVALSVSPVSLLMPITESGDEEVELTGYREPVAARALYSWLSGESALKGSRMGDSWLRHAELTFPRWRRADLVEATKRALLEMRAVMPGTGVRDGDD